MKEEPKREHNFKVVLHHPQAKPGHTKVWRCDECDSEVAFPVEFDRVMVNRNMANRMLCMKGRTK